MSESNPVNGQNCAGVVTGVSTNPAPVVGAMKLADTRFIHSGVTTGMPLPVMMSDSDASSTTASRLGQAAMRGEVAGSGPATTATPSTAMAVPVSRRRIEPADTTSFSQTAVRPHSGGPIRNGIRRIAVLAGIQFSRPW